MTLDEKLEQFYNATIESATATNLAITTEYKESLTKVFEEHKKNALAKSETAYNLEVENVKREKNRSLSSAAINIRRRLNEKSSQLSDSIFEDVKVKLQNYMKTEEYTELLKNQISEAKSFARNDELKLYMNASDEHLKLKLEEVTGVTLTISTIDFVGGTRAVIPEKNILIDHSFLSKMQELKENFTL